MLTRKQHELLRFIQERLRESGVPPSFDEMKDALDLRSKSGIHRLITALEERGFLRRLPHRARALEVVKLPEQATTPLPTPGGWTTMDARRKRSIFWFRVRGKASMNWMPCGTCPEGSAARQCSFRVRASSAPAVAEAVGTTKA